MLILTGFKGSGWVGDGLDPGQLLVHHPWISAASQVQQSDVGRMGTQVYIAVFHPGGLRGLLE